ncbi:MULTISPECIES: hypothetical protein [Dysgonomonas]|uniref:NigD-like C-terminal beta sandwich domain-containing protein n=1 Tax=Dysgonomonas gadei ATCC BAA-286 TaxID=742766 RepID=F5J438_9BACT|nr:MULTISPECIES: hypothetical protein [Dysgonomonas]EGJ99509.1 hypothetical protein HMPREF9455_04105 [Dysgonomonas gadei ATCC BAA-286]MBF0650473.1 hypothetical protein [Dysgonomonas sp. GY75]
MKKTSLLKIFCSVFSVVLLMSSCLGDGDSSFTIEKDFAYITKDDYGRKFAVTSNGYIMHDNITNLTEVNKCYFIGYKISSSSAQGYYDAEYVNILNNGNAIAQESLRLNKPYENSNLVSRNDTIVPTSVSIAAWSPANTIGDNWLIGYSLTKKERDEVKAFFYYDATNQKDSEGEIDPTKDNKIIIDVRFGITDKGTGDNNITDSFSAIGNLSYLRSSFSPNFSGVTTDYVNVPVKFRYQKYTSSGQPAEVVYIGNWQLSGSNAYYIQFKK